MYRWGEGQSGVMVLSPSDLTAYVACEHRSALDRLVADDLLVAPVRDDPELEVLRRRGDEHERAELDRLKADGREIVTIICGGRSPDDLRAAEADTLAAMRAGADVIFQATFFDGRWRGHADFLLRVDVPSGLGPWSYEVADTKLARRAKPAALLQLCAYAEQVARLQGRWPDEVEIVTGDGERHRHRVSDAVAWYRAAKARLEAAVEQPPATDTYPHPVEHCRVCPWQDDCIARRRADDHLSLVAGMRRDMTAKLGRVGITTATELAASPVGIAVPRMGLATADRLRNQARLQLAQRADGVIRYEVLPPEGPLHGLGALPPPTPADLFFDLEGDPWVDGGLEYLWGVVDADRTYRAFWAHDRASERRAFEQVVDLIIQRLDAEPSMHVYHYAPYEATVLKRLAGRFASREADIDRLLRGDVLVDLYPVVRQSVRVSQDSYGLKKLEPLYLDARGGEIADGGSSIVAYEDWLETRDDALLEDIRAYNQLDCLSTLGLRDWLEQRRDEAAALAVTEVERPPELDAAPSEAVAEADARSEALTASLLDTVPDELEVRTDEHEGRLLLAHLVGWHRRESRPEWWSYFDRLEKTDDELLDDRDSIAGLVFLDEREDTARSSVYRYSFDPTQEHKFGAGDKPLDPRTKKGAGEIVAIDLAGGVIELRRGRSGGWAHPTALVPGGPIDAKPLRDAVARVAHAVLAHADFDPARHRAVLDLLRRRPPRVRGLDLGVPLQQPGEHGTDAARRLVRDLDGGCLAVQGPPGAGKTWTGAALVVDAVRRRQRVGVTAQSHKAIGNLLLAIVERAQQEGQAIRIVQRASDEQHCGAADVRCASSNEEVEALVDAGAVDVVAGTAWLFARPELDGRFDVLVVDEAGQRSLADVVAVSGAATDLVLLGDPQQLAQVSKGTHPPGAEVSCLRHVLDGDATIAPERGVFLESTHRMHPSVCSFVSTIAYDGRLEAEPGCASQSVTGGRLEGAGLRWVPVIHEGNRTRSTEEAQVVAELVDELQGGTWVDARGQQSWVTLQDILVIAPYNAQVVELVEVLPEGARVGTVDRFQGQEAPVVIYSLAASSADDVPRGIDFLLSINRFNVAVSRARAMAIVVGSPDLLRAPCHTVEQVRLVNALCRYVEDAELVQV